MGAEQKAETEGQKKDAEGEAEWAMTKCSQLVDALEDGDVVLDVVVDAPRVKMSS